MLSLLWMTLAAMSQLTAGQNIILGSLRSIVASGCQTDGKMTVAVYYESRCPDSVLFFRNHLWPAYQKFQKDGFLKIDLVPFGRTKVISAGDIECPHGDEECAGHVMHSCAMSLYPFEVSFPFIVCTMEHLASRLVDGSITYCAANNTIDAKKIRDCQLGEQGINELMKMAGKTRELTPPPTYIPAITMNGERNSYVQSRSEFDLINFVTSSHEVCLPRNDGQMLQIIPQLIALCFIAITGLI